jgi:hypothetical protein
MPRTPKAVWDAMTSLKLTIVCMGALMVLVVSCTLAQVHLGTFGAVDIYMRRWLVWWDVPGTVFSLPVFPGGALVGAVLTVNLFAAQLRRLELSWKKAGLWIVHAGLILLVVGEFITGMYQIDTRMAIVEGGSSDHVEYFRENELAVVDITDARFDDVYSVPDSLLARADRIAIPNTDVVLNVKGFLPNADLAMRTPTDPPSAADAGIGAQIAVREKPREARDDVPNAPVAWVEPVVGGKSQGTWLASALIHDPQTFEVNGHTYELYMRARRMYLPYTLTLKDFRHDVYPGTEIPKNFSSLVHLSNPGTGESRDVLIYMNQPLRYDGKAFFQASFGQNDTLSVLQVVQNPGWLLPYISCVLVTIGLLVHFAITLRRSVRRRAAEAQAADAPTAPPTALEASR